MDKKLLLLIFLLIATLGGLYLFESGKLNNVMTTKSTNLNLEGQGGVSPASSPVPSSSPVAEASPAADAVTFPDGLITQDIVVGTGAEAKAGDTVTMNYVGTLENGFKFDSSYDRNQPFSTQIGVGQVIKGWDEGVPGMKVGGKRKLTIPAALGYGDQGAGTIPPNSTLIFEVELLQVK